MTKRGYYYPTVRLDADAKILALGGNNCTLNEPLNTIHAVFSQGNWTDLPDGGFNLHGNYPIVNILTYPSYANGDVSIITKWKGRDSHKRLNSTYSTWSDFDPWPSSSSVSMAAATATPLMYHAPGLPPPTYPNGSVIVFGTGSTLLDSTLVRVWRAPILPSDTTGWWINSVDHPALINPTAYPRNQGDCVYLPNGKILVVGGGLDIHPSGCDSSCVDPVCPGDPACPEWWDDDAVKQFGHDFAILGPEMYDPETGQTQTMAKAIHPRLYHSVALLLPDGRVYVSGGQHSRCVLVGTTCAGRGTAVDSFEIFSPPYIFDSGPRLKIASAPSEFRYGYKASFTVDGSFTNSELKVLLIKPGSVTHSRNFDQRVVRLNVTNVSTVDSITKCVQVAVPARSTNLLPPGYYMLWVSKNDVPCEMARFVKLTNGVGDIATCPGSGDPFAQFVNRLEQNYPNPFNPYTMIRYSIKERSHVTLRIYNVAGQLVRTLVDEAKGPVGGGAYYNVVWDGRSDAGHRVPSGVYVYQLVTPDFKKTRKLVVLK